MTRMDNIARRSLTGAVPIRCRVTRPRRVRPPRFPDPMRRAHLRPGEHPRRRVKRPSSSQRDVRKPSPRADRLATHSLNALVAFGLSVVLAGACALEDGTIGVLYVGCMTRSQPFSYMRSDPLFSISFVIATLRDWAWMPENEVYRRVRLYMPRTYQDLVENFDVTVLANANRLAVGTHIDKLARGVEEGGMGLLMSGGWESYGGTGTAYPPWGDTAIGRLLPTEDVIDIWEQSGRPVFDKPDHELIHSLPWNLKDPMLANPIRWHHNPVTLKPGAEMLAHVISDGGSEDPLMVTWQLPNEARVFALTSEIHHLSCLPGPSAATQYSSPWEYAIDLGGNLMIYLDNRPVPQDVAIVHAARLEMLRVATRRSLLMGLLEFCESFGASTRRLASQIGEIDAAVAAAKPEYLQLHFEQMLDIYRSAGSLLDAVEKDAIKLKNATLAWVYAVEWLAVTATGMVCAFLLWSLMVRRALYKEVRVTALRNA